MKNEKNLKPLWFHNGRSKSISHTAILEFIKDAGYCNIKLSANKKELVKIENNKIQIATISDIREFVSDYFQKQSNDEIYETFLKGISAYIAPNKIDILNSVEVPNIKDDSQNINFYFENTIVSVSKDNLIEKSYSDLAHPIWENRIIKSNFNHAKIYEKPGQFEQFIRNVSGSEERFKSLCSILGYLLHRNKETTESKAVILYDELMGSSNGAHGGTGKTLIGKALKQCRDIAEYDGKHIKENSNFLFQRIELSTDLLFYDDLKKNFDFEKLYPLITSGVEVEKKGKQSFFIDSKDSPKILITSNYPIKGSGGSSENRRKIEFALSNYYNEKFTPSDEFGNRFFNESWDEYEWNSFYHFMMKCAQVYLSKGIIELKSENLIQNKLKAEINENFYEFVSNLDLKYDFKYDKSEIVSQYNEKYPQDKLSSHMITKYLSSYFEAKKCNIINSSSNGTYTFKISNNLKSDGYNL